MRHLLDDNDRQFLERMHRLGTVGVQDLCDDLGVTATAVRQKLRRLQGTGLISRELIRAGRGRPHYHYRVTELALRELGSNYADLAMIMWREIQRVDDPEIRRGLLQGIEDALVIRYGRVVTSEDVEIRMAELGSVLAENGFDVDVDTSGPLPILRENNCPYHELASTDSTICEIERNVFQRVIGRDMTLGDCCLDGQSCCEFHVGGQSED